VKRSTSYFADTTLARAVAEQLRANFNPHTPAKRVFNLAEAAEYCGLTRESFKKKVVRDRLRKVRVDKCCRFDIADLDQWIDTHKEQIAEETAP
jgi:predicted DNA-binding transcriptional regulator AlpA